MWPRTPPQPIRLEFVISTFPIMVRNSLPVSSLMGDIHQFRDPNMLGAAENIQESRDRVQTMATNFPNLMQRNNSDLREVT